MKPAINRTPITLSLAALIILMLTPVVGFSYDWLQFNGDPQHSGNNTTENTINAGNVHRLHKLFQVALPSIADGSPVYLSSVTTQNGLQDLIFVTTKEGHILALDATTGAQAWSRQNPAGACRINNGIPACYTTSSPAIDPDRSFVYSYGLDGFVHKYLVGDGTEITGNGWPEPASLKPFDEKGSSALSIATAANGISYLYVTNGGYPGDAGDYQGHVTAVNLSDGSQNVFNADCSDQAIHFVETPGTPDCVDVQSAIWARAGVVYDSKTDKIYMATGNGTFSPGAFSWGDTLFALHPAGTGINGGPLDSYTPATFLQLQLTDSDLGSTSPAILPTPAGSKVSNLAVQGGKDKKLRLLNLDNLSGQSGTGHVGGEIGRTIPVPQGGEVLTTPAVWVQPVRKTSWVFIANGNGISGLKLAVGRAGNPSLQPVWQSPNGGTSPIVANGILFYIGSGFVRALNPTTGHLLWRDALLGGIHWESPIVANGKLYFTDENANFIAYRIPL
jgi:outer membrane protein assembly factor BamB